MYRMKLEDGRELSGPSQYRDAVRRTRELSIYHRMAVELYRNGELLDKYVFTELGPKSVDVYAYLPLEMRIGRSI